MSIGYVAGKSGQQSPGIIDMYGMTGGLAEYRAAILASRGFTVLAVAFFNYDDLPKDLSVIDLHYFDVSLLFFVLLRNGCCINLHWMIMFGKRFCLK